MVLNQRRFDEAVALHRAGRLDEAAGKYAALLQLNPGDADLLHLSGILAGQRGNHAESLSFLRRAVARAPNVLDYRNSLAKALERENDRASSAAAHNEHGNMLLGARRYEEALAEYDRALALIPDSGHYRCNRGAALTKLGRYDEAAKLLYRVPDEGRLSFVPLNLGNALVGLGHIDEALAAYARALVIEPDLVEAHWARGQALLLLGRFQEGWAEYEWRRRWGGLQNPYDDLLPAWKGESASALGGALLVVSEQGLGDTIQFARYLPMLTRAGHRIVFEVQDGLRSLFAHSFRHDWITILPRSAALASGGAALRGCKARVPLLSLPYIFATDAATIPSVVPYLAVPSRDLALATGPGPKIGLVRSGQPRHGGDLSRSVAVEALAPLLQRPARFFSLQITPFDAPGVTELGFRFHDFADTAAALAAMDLVISVDTSVAHLAGALGEKLWLMLPHTPDWRWGLTGERSPWYPTATLFRQTTRGDWGGVIGRIAGEIDGFITSYAAEHHG